MGLKNARGEGKVAVTDSREVVDRQKLGVVAHRINARKYMTC